MDIALLFWDQFPSDNEIGGRCIPLFKGFGPYRIGRSGHGSPDFEIDIQNRLFSRQAARYTIGWNPMAKAWQIADLGFTKEGIDVVSNLQSFVDGQEIPRLATGYPDPVSIGPGTRLLLGGEGCRVLVLAECETTVTTENDPFLNGPWGIEKLATGPTPKPKPEPEPVEDMTVSTPLLRDAIATAEWSRGITRSTARGLVNRETRGETAVSLILWVLLAVSVFAGLVVWQGRLPEPARMEQAD